MTIINPGNQLARTTLLPSHALTDETVGMFFLREHLSRVLGIEDLQRVAGELNAVHNAAKVKRRPTADCPVCRRRPRPRAPRRHAAPLTSTSALQAATAAASAGSARRAGAPATPPGRSCSACSARRKEGIRAIIDTAMTEITLGKLALADGRTLLRPGALPRTSTPSASPPPCPCHATTAISVGIPQTGLPTSDPRPSWRWTGPDCVIGLVRDLLADSPLVESLVATA